MMEFEVKLFDTTGLAADGSNIPKRSCEEYLTSPDYRTVVRDKVGLGGVTHKDRKLTPEMKGLIGMDDLQLVNDNTTHYYTSLYFKSGDNFLYATAKTFDPSLFSGKRADNIQNLIGMLQTGVRMPISVVIQALWSKRGSAEKIIRIKGFDFTLNPSFKGAGDIQLFSETLKDEFQLSEDQTREFSASLESGDLVMQTKVFSSYGECYVLEDEGLKSFSGSKELFDYDSLFCDRTSVTPLDIMGKYGTQSPQYKLTKEYVGSHLTMGDLKKIADKNSDSIDKSIYKKIIEESVDNGQESLQSLNRSRHQKLPKILTGVPDSDPNKDKMTEVRLAQFFETRPNKEYSLVPSIQGRVNNESQPRLIRVERLFRGYQNYINSNKITDNTLSDIMKLWVQDINLLIKDGLPDIVKGRDFNSLYGFSRFDPLLVPPCRRLSITYRKLLLSQKVLGFIPKLVYEKWTTDMMDFHNALSNYMFREDIRQEVNIIDL